MSEILEDILKHHGTKGMKWGVITKGRDAVKKTASKATTRVKEEVGSLKRENSWRKQAKNVKNMSNNDLNKMVNRLQLENDLKKLSRTAEISGKKDRADYRTRGKMSDQQLVQTVGRLRAKERLNRNLKEVTAKQDALGRKLSEKVGQMAIKHVFNYDDI